MPGFAIMKLMGGGGWVVEGRIFLRWCTPVEEKKILSVKTTRYSQSYKCFIIIVKTQSELMIFSKFPGRMTSFLIELSWQHSHLLSSLEGEENSILLVLILWKAKQSAMFLRMLLLPFKINDDLKESVPWYLFRPF